MLITSSSTPKISIAPPKMAKAKEQSPSEVYTPDRGETTGSFTTMLKRGAHFAAFFGAPAALGAAGSQVGEAVGKGFDQVLSTTAGTALGAGYGLVHGGYAGWASVPGKQAGGIMMALYMVPAAAVGGSVLGTGLAIAGAAGGWPVAAGLAGAGFVGGMIHGYFNPQVDKF